MASRNRRQVLGWTAPWRDLLDQLSREDAEHPGANVYGPERLDGELDRASPALGIQPLVENGLGIQPDAFPGNGD